MYGVSRIRIEYISCESRTDYDICVPNIVLQSTWYMIGRVRWIEWRLPSGWWPHTFMQQIRFSVLRLNQNGGILPWEKSRRMIFFSTYFALIIIVLCRWIESEKSEEDHQARQNVFSGMLSPS